MAWDKGFNFRETSGYVTDAAGDTYVIPADTYPTTRNGVTFGWTVAATGQRDRNSLLDPKVAGVAFGNGVGTFRVDLPAAGTYSVRLAMGDQGSPQTASQIKVKDNGTVLFTIGPHDTVNDLYDANDVARVDAATWVAANTARSVTFATTSLFVTLEAATSSSVIAHLFVSQTSAAASGAWDRNSRVRAYLCSLYGVSADSDTTTLVRRYLDTGGPDKAARMRALIVAASA